MSILELICLSLAYGNEYATFEGRDEKVPYFFPTGRVWRGGGTGWVSPFTQLSHDFGFLPPSSPFCPGNLGKIHRIIQYLQQLFGYKNAGGCNIVEDFDF
jgi:hypothetical protein